MVLFFFLMIRRPPRSTLDRSSAASDVYKRQYLQLSPPLTGRALFKEGVLHTSVIHQVTQSTQMSTDAGFKVREIKFSRKHRRWKRIPQNRGGRKEGSPTANKPGITNINTKLMRRHSTPCATRAS